MEIEIPIYPEQEVKAVWAGKCGYLQKTSELKIGL